MNKNLRITYEFGRRKEGNRVSKEEIEKYLEWAKQMYYDQELNFCVNEILGILGVSWPWIDNHILENCRSIRYLNVFKVANKNDPDNSRNIYVNLEEVSQYLMNISIFDRQTKLVDYLKNYAGISELQYLEIIKTKGQTQGKKLDHDFYHNLSQIEPNYDSMVDLERKRSKVPRVSVKKFNFLGDMIDYYKNEKTGQDDTSVYKYMVANRSMFRNSEQLYRYVFRNGGIRIRIGDKKTIFAFEKHGYAYPQNTIVAYRR